MNNISRWAINNPIPTLVLFIVLTVAGLYGFGKLRINSNPDIDIPTVTVTVAETGAAPTELETQVATVVEDAVAGLDNVDTVSSTLSEGASTTSVAFVLGTDINRATNDVQNAVNGIIGSLPAGATTPVVKRVESTGNAILTYVVDAPAMSPDALSWYVDNDVGKALLGVSGVGSIARSGGVDRIIRVKLDPDRLSALGITATQVSQGLVNVNANKPGGRIAVGGREQTIRTLGGVSTLEALADTRLTLNGQTVRIADLGTVEDTWSAPRQSALFNGKSVVAFSVYRTVGSSEIHTSNAVRARIAQLAGEHPDVKFTEVSSSSPFVQESYDAAIDALLLGALLAVGVVFLFLRDIRATIISAIAMPFSLIPTFAVMWYLNLSLNAITLLALSLVVGILVDDAIVEIENIVRHMRESGKSAFQAAIEAADEIGLAVVATTGTLIAIFVPVAFMPGIAGQFFKSFGIAIAVSVFFSLVVARLLTPLLGAYFLKPHGGKHEDSPAWVPAYLWLLRAALRFRWVTLFLGIALFAGSLFLATQLPTEFLTASDKSRSLISVQLPPGSSLSDTERVVKSVTQALADQPEVSNIYAAIGTATAAGIGGSSAGSAGSVNSATVTVNLVDRDKRHLSQQQFEAANAARLQAIPGARLSFNAGGLSGAGISVTLVGDNPDDLTAASAELFKEIGTIKGLSNPTSDDALTSPQLVVVPDGARASEVGVTANDIAQTVNVATLGDNSANLPKFNAGDRQLPIVVSLGDNAITDADALALLPIKGTNATVPLGSVAKISFAAGPTTIKRVDRIRQNTVNADLNGITLGQATARIAELPIMKQLPKGVSELKQGDSQALADLFGSFAVVMGTGILLMYMTLVLLFKSFIQPITILVALPLSIGGALGLLYLTGHAMGITPLIGILMLLGIAAKNSILLVEYTMVARQKGSDRISALIGGASKRVRPIVMTSIAMGVGMLPIALGFGADAETRAPMAIAVIGGLITSTLLSLIYVPVVFTFMDDLEAFCGKWLGKLLVARRPAAAEPSASRHSTASPGMLELSGETP